MIKRNVVYVMPPRLGPVSQFISILPEPLSSFWQFQLLNYLNNIVDNLSIKPHPESPTLINNFYDSELKINIIDGRFENVIDPNDICIFDYQGTTTFGYAIKNQNPIILIDFNTHTLKEMDHEVRAKRVFTIQGYFNDKNIPTIDFDELKRGIDVSTQLNDTEFEKLILGSD